MVAVVGVAVGVAEAGAVQANVATGGANVVAEGHATCVAVANEDALAAQPTPVLTTATRCRGRCEAGSVRESVDVAETCGRSRG